MFYTNNLILFFINIDENMRNQRKIQEIKGYTYKIIHILALKLPWRSKHGTI